MIVCSGLDVGCDGGYNGGRDCDMLVMVMVIVVLIVVVVVVMVT